MSPRKCAVVVALVGMLLLLFWLVPVSATGGLVFAQVQAQVEKTKSVQFVQTRNPVPRKGEPAWPTTEQHVMILGRYLKRTQFKVTKAGDKLPGGAQWGSMPMEETILIEDAEHGKVLSLSPDRKKFSVIERSLSVSPDLGRIETHKIKPCPQVDYYEDMRRIPADRVEKLPERIIDGKKAIGFRLVNKDERTNGGYTGTITYWVDPQTRLPIRVEVANRSTDPRRGQEDAVQSDFIFDAPLDRSLFSTDPPEGYTAFPP